MAISGHRVHALRVDGVSIPVEPETRVWISGDGSQWGVLVGLWGEIDFANGSQVHRIEVTGEDGLKLEGKATVISSVPLPSGFRSVSMRSVDY